MKKAITLLTFSVITLCTALGQTMVNGIIDSNTTWTLENSPYIIDGNVLVEESFELTIEPGVEVKFDLSIRMVVRGALIAKGTSDSKITFTSNQNSPAPSDWEGIIFKPESVDAVTDSIGEYMSGSIIEYATIEYAGDKVYDPSLGGAIKIEESSPYIAYNVIQNNHFSKKNEDGGAISIRNNSNPIIKYNYISNNIAVTGGGICIRAGGGIIENNYFINNEGTNKGGAIYIWGTNSNLFLVNNLIEENTSPKGGCVYIRSTGNSNTYKGNSFINNSSYEVYREFLGDLTIDFSGNYWNTTDVSQIPDKIYDFYDDFETGIIGFEEILTENDISVYDPNVVSTIDKNVLADVKMYPNPASEFLQIDSDIELLQINIFELNGQLTKSITGSNRIDVSDINAGIYIVELKLGNLTLNKKIVIH